MGKDTLKVLGASNHCDAERSKLDYYGTDPRSTRALLEVEKFEGPIWEPCAGHHLMVNVLKEAGYEVRSSDIAEYEGYEHEIIDFLEFEGDWDGDIVTNPPYNLSVDFAVKCLEMLKPGRNLAMFLRTQWLEGIQRYERIFKDNPPVRVYIFKNRQTSSKVDDFSVGSAVSYAWFVWEKGFKGKPTLDWISTDKKDETEQISLF